MRVLEPEERTGKGGGVFGRGGRNVHLDERCEEGGADGIKVSQGSGEGCKDERARQRQRTGKRRL